MGISTRVMAGTRTGAKSGQGDLFPRLLRFLLAHCSSAPILHYSVTVPTIPFPTRFSATFPAVFLSREWRPVASPRRRRGGKN